MNKVVILSRKKIQFYAIAAVIVVIAVSLIGWRQTRPASAPAIDGTQVYQLVTGEFNATTDSGDKLESYGFHPGVIIVKKGSPVELRITGINGQAHPFVIEGLGITGEVRKGKTTIVRFTPKEAGTYSIVCQTHNDSKSGGPMVGYLIVQ